MGEEERWNKVRQIVREECERIESRIRAVLEEATTTKKGKVAFKDGEFTGLDVEKLKELYPAVDVESQVREMRAYLLLNPSGAPKTQYGAFVHRWLTKHQNAASLRLIPSRRDPEPGPGKKLCAYCDQVSTGVVNAISHCRAHALDAMDEKPIPRMRGIQAKAVAGE